MGFSKIEFWKGPLSSRVFMDSPPPVSWAGPSSNFFIASTNNLQHQLILELKTIFDGPNNPYLVKTKDSNAGHMIRKWQYVKGPSEHWYLKQGWIDRFDPRYEILDGTLADTIEFRLLHMVGFCLIPTLNGVYQSPMVKLTIRSSLRLI